MRFVVDANGRLRVPRPLLEAAGLQAGKSLEFEIAQDGSLRIRAAPAPTAALPTPQTAPPKSFAASDRLDDLPVA
ncbi:MAG TPA: hypothetical protein VI997_08120 [Candidatus Thermoplasmatota archaeon]|nr:hypothetical protein [Candidatus Thermoplasmatota archaeon]